MGSCKAWDFKSAGVLAPYTVMRLARQGFALL
jgi:hypothetical protein